MSIEKVFGIVWQPIGTKASVRIKVVAYTKNGTTFKDENQINNEFLPEGFVFAPNLSIEKYKLMSLIEFSINPNSTGHGTDKIIMNTHVEPRKVGFPVIHIEENIFINDFSINLEILTNCIGNKNYTHFYIIHSGFFYGPFKIFNGEVKPIIGKEVGKFDNEELVSYKDKFFLINKPKDEISKIDCMDQIQLGEWFKNQIKLQEIKIDFNKLKKSFENIEFSGLDKVRLERAIKNIDQLSLGFDELKILSETSSSLKKIYDNQLNEKEKELRKEVIDPINSEKKLYEIEINNLKQNIAKLKKDEKKYSSEVEKVKSEHEYILVEKNRLIEDIKVHSIVQEAIQMNSDKLLTFDEQLFEQKGNPYEDLDEFISMITDSIDSNKLGNSNFFRKAITQLKDFKCILSDNLEIIIHIGKFSNNCKIIIQQVEPDWLKFNYLFNNGLKHIWKSAHENPDLIHFFVLEDINMASIECYSKPILDLLSGVRENLPELKTKWPMNLRIFAIPIDIPMDSENQEFALPLIKHTFRNWGAFPKITLNLLTSVYPEKYLPLNILLNHNEMFPISLDEYFTKDGN